MDEAHFRPPRPARTAKALTGLALAALLCGVIGWLRLGWVPGVVGVVAAAVLGVLAALLNRVELIVRRTGIEVVDITGRRRQAWVGTKRLVIDFARPRPLLEIDAPGPSQTYRSTLVLAGLEQPSYAQQRQELSDLVHRWAGADVRVEFHEPPPDSRPPES
ncbi:MAG TPA: hypothetical protein VGA36_02700 [Nitriliruptorales bacterium]